ncbi:MAG: T9SS type A sorting domain-containing protein [Bacteroidetes bacterium]|nr:T9SS type A sorting domain-containing protein [Bacteroidota bacterium]
MIFWVLVPKENLRSRYITNTGKQTDYSVIIYNSMGLKAKESTNSPLKIPIFDLASGLYQVVVRTNDEVFTKNM